MSKSDINYNAVMHAKIDEICDRIESGEALRVILKSNGMPNPREFYAQIELDDYLQKRYARAKRIQGSTFAEEVVTIADEDCTTVKTDDGVQTVVFDHVAVARNRMRIDARKWAASKLDAPKYGDNAASKDDKPVDMAGVIAELSKLLPG